MRSAYPVVISKTDDGYFVTIPDFEINTQGEDVADAMVMARDAIELMGITFEDDGKPLPKPGTAKAEKEFDDDIITLVDVDFTAYRKKLDDRAVRKNCTIPYWLNVEAEKNNVNFSRVLQDALMEKLHVTKRH
ncbi:type II toxin-antitoxin system HicB family antitoxin [Acetobacterium wieringae]|uniref:type II toxin-antitoxin system HicB family antitoxin n=1 Tax=Acetobacterium wieringae TaxID=52694 RepID=UPI0031594658